jgi:superfamily II DNA or RNA helicase
VSEFSWDEVHPLVLRALLRAVYLDAEDGEEVKRVRTLSDAAARTTAQDRLGSPPKPRVFTPSVYEALRQTWLPRADAAVVERLVLTVRLTLSGTALQESVATKGDQVTFLRNRRWTNNLEVNLRKAFISAHRKERVVDVVSGSGQAARSRFDLEGSGAAPSRPWYRHQARAQERLDKLWADDTLQGRLVFPTGAGKTDTIVGWLLAQLAADPELRVLWLVHQQELAVQAMGRFTALARRQPAGFTREARVVHSQASSLSTLADDQLDVAAVTYQSFRSLTSMKRRLLQRFLDRPTIVVIDEAHHVGAPSFDDLLSLVAKHPKARGVIGLTATPYPSTAAARARFRDRFPELIGEVSIGELIREQILAQPVVTVVDTGEAITLTDAQVAQATSSDIPSAVLNRLDALNRNRLVVRTWMGAPDDWGKTLAFATSIQHADNLVELFKRSGVDAQALHSEVRDRAAPLKWFRESTTPVVLVSVGMLTEGVDLPDARTAFLARPTTSPILMRQMVGRVLRGPKAGGDAEAHVVHFRDEWSNLPDVLYPEEVLPDSRPALQARDGKPWTPGPIIDDHELEIRADLAAQVARSFERLAALFNLDDDDPFNDRPPEPLLRSARLVGFYDLIESVLPVFEHQLPGYQALIGDALRFDLKGTPLLSYFDDAPPPYPSGHALRQLVELARELDEAPELRPCAAELGPARAARRVLDAGPLTELERNALVREEFERSLNRLAYTSLEKFEEAVEQHLRELRRPTPRLDAEANLPTSTTDKTLPKLPRAERDLEPARRQAIETACEILPPSFWESLGSVPEVRWTRRCVKSTWAHWSLRMSGRGKGKAMIRVNRVLRTTAKHVPDEVLAYLVFHEMLHHLLPGQGHDAEFRELEALWPDAEHLDLTLDTLHEKWDTRPEQYSGDIGS